MEIEIFIAKKISNTQGGNGIIIINTIRITPKATNTSKLSFILKALTSAKSIILLHFFFKFT